MRLWDVEVGDDGLRTVMSPAARVGAKSKLNGKRLLITMALGDLRRGLVREKGGGSVKMTNNPMNQKDRGHETMEHPGGLKKSAWIPIG
jgi:hypothetical protein